MSSPLTYSLSGGRHAKHGGRAKAKRKLPIPLVLVLIGIFTLCSVMILLQRTEQVGHGSTHDLRTQNHLLAANIKAIVPTAPDGGVTDKPPKITNETNFVTGDRMLIPSPVLVVSLPKSGTTSTWKYFLCGLGKGHASHQWGAVHGDMKHQVQLGKCFDDNIRAHKPLLEGCGNYEVWTDAGYMVPGRCFYPSLHGGLENFVEFYPHGTLINVVRDTQSWVNSTTEFNDLWARWSEKCDKFPKKGSTLKDYADFYDWHTNMVRSFAKDHPSLQFIEISLEALDAGVHLQLQTGINASCWFNSRTKKGRNRNPKLKNRQQKKTKP